VPKSVSSSSERRQPWYAFCCSCAVRAEKEDAEEQEEEKEAEEGRRTRAQKWKPSLRFLLHGFLQPKNKGKGGKNRRRGKNDNEESKRELLFKEDGQVRVKHRLSCVMVE